MKYTLVSIARRDFADRMVTWLSAWYSTSNFEVCPEQGYFIVTTDDDRGSLDGILRAAAQGYQAGFLDSETATLAEYDAILGRL